MPILVVSMAVWSDIISLFTLLLCIIQCAASLKLPSDLGKELYCAGCEAVAKELYNQLKSKSSDSLEVRVADALEDICDAKHFRKQEQRPKSIVRACQYLLEQHDEDMEQILIAHMRVNDSQGALDKRICHMLSKACLGIRTIKKPKDPREEDEYKNFRIDIDKNAKYARPVPESAGKDEL